MKFSAVILAGGKSSRMGRDKAWLDVDGQPLLARQIQIAREAGASEVFISGRDGIDYAQFKCCVLRDRLTDAGPLAGIEAALVAATTPLLLALAVDMPEMNADLLRRLVAQCEERCGAIPRVSGFAEPLAALYPKASVKLLDELLNARLCLPMNSERRLQAAGSGREVCALPPEGGVPVHGDGERPGKYPGAKHFAERCVTAGLARFVDMSDADAHYFANWNSPADLSCLR